MPVNCCKSGGEGWVVQSSLVAAQLLDVALKGVHFSFPVMKQVEHRLT